MNFLYNWPFVLLLGIPVIILLYLLKQKAEDTPVSSLYLWREAARNLEAHTPWERFRNNILMYLQILVLLAMILALASPLLSRGGIKNRAVVLVLDNSGSMNASFQKDLSRLDAAKAQAEDYVDRLVEETAVTVITGNESAEILLTNSHDKGKIKKVIEGIEQTDLPGDLAVAAELAASMAGQREECEILFFSDRAIGQRGESGRQISFASQGKNAAVDFVSPSIREDGQITVLARATNYGSEEIESEIDLYLDSRLLGVEEISLLPGESGAVYFDGVSNAKNGMLKAELHDADDLQRDNAAYARLEADEKNKALLVTEKNIFLEKAILTDSNIELYKTTSIEQLNEETVFDLYLYDGTVPKTLPKKGNLLFINPPEKLPESFFLFDAGEKMPGTYVSPGDHEIARYLEDLSFGVEAYRKIELPPWAEGFLYAGEDCVGFCGNTDGRFAAVLAFDFHDSDLPLKTEFPILIYNLLSRGTKKSFFSKGVYQAGEPVVWTGTKEGKDPLIQDEEGRQEQMLRSATGELSALPKRAGLYKVEMQTGDGAVTGQTAVNFPASSESWMGAADLAEQGQEAAAKESGGFAKITDGMDLVPYALGIILVLLTAEWIFYIRKL